MENERKSNQEEYTVPCLVPARRSNVSKIRAASHLVNCFLGCRLLVVGSSRREGCGADLYSPHNTILRHEQDHGCYSAQIPAESRLLLVIKGRCKVKQMPHKVVDRDSEQKQCKQQIPLTVIMRTPGAVHFFVRRALPADAGLHIILDKCQT